MMRISSAVRTRVKDEFLRVMDIISIVFESMDFENFEAQISLRDKVNREKIHR